MTVGVALPSLEQHKISPITSAGARTTKANLQGIQSHIQNGLFATDRVSLDPAFSYAQAANRYANWLDDILDSGGAVFEVEFESDVVGFFTLQENGDGHGNGALNGLFRSFQGKGLGTLFHQAILRQATREGFSHYTSRISSNNLSGLRAALSAGMAVDAIDCVFVRHAAEQPTP